MSQTLTKSTLHGSMIDMQRVTTHEAKTHLSKILARVEQGEEFTVCRGEVPVALVSPVVEARRPKQRPAVGTITSAG